MIRPYRPEDEADVLEVIGRSYYGLLNAEVFRWRHSGPKSAIDGSMVAEVDGQVVGIQSMEILPFDLDGRMLTGGVLSGLVVHPDFRRRGLFKAMVEGCETHAWERGASFVTTMPNYLSYPGFIKMRYTDLGRRDLFVCVLSPAALAASLYRSRVMKWALGTLASPFAALLFARKPQILHATCTPAIDPAVSKLTELQRRSVLPGLQMVRSLEWWEWRFLRSPVRDYTFCEARDESGALMAIATGTVQWHNRCPVGYLVDMCGTSEDGLVGAISGMSERFQAEGIPVVVCVVSSPAMGRILRRSGFVRVPQWFPLQRFHTVVRWNPRMVREMPEYVAKITGWHLTLGDWDNI